MRSALSILVLFCLTACHGGDNGGPEYNLNVRDIWDLQLTLASDATPAGESVGLEVQLISEDGDIEEVQDWTLESDSESPIQWSRDSVTPTHAAVHHLTAFANANDKTYSADATLIVGAGAAYVVDLALSDHGVTAGDSLNWTLSAADRFGNPIDTSSIVPVVDSTEVTVGDGTLTSVTPGTYTASAVLDTASDHESFVVVPTEPVSIELTLSDTDPEVFQTVSATVVVLDAHGNSTDDPWTLSVDGDGDTDIYYNNITFWEEGWYTVIATVDGTSLSDRVGPFLIDSTGPVITMDSPERGAWVEGDTSTVSGNVTDEWSAIASLTVNGSSVATDSSGNFSTEEDWEFGINVLETSASDLDGNTSTDTRALLAGEFIGYGEGVDNGIVIRLEEGAGGLGTLESLGEGLISETDLGALIPSPVFSDSSTSCFDPCFGLFGGCEFCVTWYSVDLYVTNPTFSSTDFDMDCQSTGVIETTMTINDPSLDWSASGKVIGISYSGSGDITADDIGVVMDLEPYVASRTLYMDVSSVTASATNFYFDWDSWLYDVLSFFGVDAAITSLIEDAMVDAIEDAVYDMVPSLMEDLLSSLELGSTLTIEGADYELDARPSDVSVDSTGLVLDLETTFTAQNWVISRTGEGSLYYGYGDPTWSTSSGMNLGMSDDFINQILFALWGGGLLDRTLVGSDMGLDPADLATFFPGLTELTIDLDALLPPVVIPGSGSEMLEMQMGDVHLTLYNGDTSTGTVLFEVYFSAFMTMDLDATATSLSTELGAPEMYFDVLQPEANTTGAADAEALLETLVPLLLPSLTGALGEIPIPEIEGFTITGLTVNTDGPEDGFAVIQGSLEAE